MRTNSLTAGRKHPAGRRHPLASIALITIGLLATGGAYALMTTTASAETTAAAQSSISEGQKLFASNCATCHGRSAEGTTEGPSLYGVGAASVDFQMGTGRMPLAFQGPQGAAKPPQFTQEQIDAVAAYVASLAPGPAIPDEKWLAGDGDVTAGAELFRINCAMCHNVAGAGGALTQGKFAPALAGVDARHAYEAMVTGPQNMPVFSDLNLTPQDKANLISFLKYQNQHASPGGVDLGGLGPVAEGLFIWIFGLGAIVGVTIWITARPN
ncbi:MAG TPA: cytochrome c [Terrimesophilobacter sp.]|uniref:cytochrome bc1 complex diheme cytochrome c subunit n=1 Tax=Terrimesophilobacter sp. TaxID=2906435 RepID=UPI002F9411BF